MLLAFRCPEITKSQIDSLIDSGHYKDLSEVVVAAVANLQVFEADFSASKARTSTRAEAQSGGPVEPGQWAESIPSLFLCRNRAISIPATAIRSDVGSRQSQYTLDQWMLGQFNRLLPAKANVRAIVHLATNGSVDVNNACSAIAEEAVNLRSVLEAIDAERGFKRDQALATAFPQNNDKSKTRYGNQFVAYRNSRGEVSSLLVDLRFVIGRDDGFLMPTKAAYDWASMPNPVLDGTGQDPTRFSPEERTFLCNHILESVPQERFAYSTILNAVIDGHVTPAEIDKQLEPLAPRNREKELSTSFLASQRSGAVSRMSDLCLIDRVRKGVHVEYVATEEGRDFLAQLHASPNPAEECSTAM